MYQFIAFFASAGLLVYVEMESVYISRFGYFMIGITMAGALIIEYTRGINYKVLPNKNDDPIIGLLRTIAVLLQLIVAVLFGTACAYIFGK